MKDQEIAHKPLDTDKCVFCGEPATKLCDFPTGVIITSIDFIAHRTTCSRPMCDECAVRIDNDVDFCPKCVEDFCRTAEQRKIDKAISWRPKSVRKNNLRKKGF